MLADRYGLEIATSSPQARDAYVEGVDLLLTAYPGAVAAFDLAIAADPGFALAHVARARSRQLLSDVPGARVSMAAAQATTARLSERELSHVNVFSLLLDGKLETALEAVRRHAAQWPRDVLVASIAANQTGLIGTSGRDGREQDQLDFLAALAPHYGDDWWFNSHYAMALSELGHHGAARSRIERSIADRPHNAYAAHAFAHLHYETGDSAAAIEFLRSWLAEYPPEGTLGGHLSWHLALAHLEQGDVDEGLRLYQQAFAADDYRGPALIKLLDGPSFLWRAELAGHPRDQARWRALQDFAHRTFPRPGTAFADWHMALIDAVLNDTTSSEAREIEIENLIRAERYPAGSSVPTVARAFAAFQRDDHETAIRLLETMFDERARLSGSRAQIDLVEFTLLKSYLATNRSEEARRLVEARRRSRVIPVAGLGAMQTP